MNDKKPDTEADIKAAKIAEDRGEQVTLMEPLLVRESGRHREALADLSVELTAVSTTAF